MNKFNININQTDKTTEYTKTTNDRNNDSNRFNLYCMLFFQARFFMLFSLPIISQIFIAVLFYGMRTMIHLHNVIFIRRLRGLSFYMMFSLLDKKTFKVIFGIRSETIKMFYRFNRLKKFLICHKRKRRFSLLIELNLIN